MLDPDQSSDVNGVQLRRLLLRLDKVIPSDPTLLDELVGDITAELDTTACWADAETIGLAVREAIANAIVHGSRGDPEKTVRISVAVTENCDLSVNVKDSGPGFDPSALPNPIATENLLAPHGRGIFIMRQLMDEVDFKFDHGTEVHMERKARMS